MSSQIYLYSGPGASQLCTDALEKQVKNISDDRVYSIRKFTDFNEYWNDPKSIKAVFVPGGNAAEMLCANNLYTSPYAVTERIQKFNIAYFGVCAGGILASKNLHGRGGNYSEGFSEKGGAYLGLYQGNTIAPLFQPKEFGNSSIEDVKLLPVHFQGASQSKSIKVVHLYSPAYLNVNQVVGAESLAKYDSLPVYLKISYNFRDRVNEYTGYIYPHELSESVFYKTPEAPPVLLTGAHLEIDSATVRTSAFKNAFNTTNDKQNQLATVMEDDDTARVQLLESYFQKLDIACKKV